jgi:ABC-type transport system involved in multi-copper enzyme maturation permease subunit
MIRLFVFKDFYQNITSARFVIGFLLCLVLIPFSVIINLNDYENQVRVYQNDKKEAERSFKDVRVYSALRPEIVKPPEPLSIFCRGISNNLGNKVKVRLDNYPVFAEGNAITRDNPLLNAFFSFDFITMIAIVFSLLAIVFTYDSFSREREDGTLKLVLTNCISRSVFLSGKLLGTFITLFPIILFCFLLAGLVIVLSPMVSFTASGWLNMALLFLLSLLYATFFILLGTFISSKLKNSAQSIVIGLFTWVIFLFIIPNMAVYLAKNFIRIGSFENVQSASNELDQEMWK